MTVESPAAAPHPANRLLTAGEVSEILRVPRSTVYELARERRIPFLKVGRRTLFDPQLLSEWIARQGVPARH
jgi:excisionase family DNA binding protein